MWIEEKAIISSVKIVFKIWSSSSLPITDSLMIQHLRQIEFSLGRKLLAFLFDLLDTDSQDENETHFEQVRNNF